MWATAAMVALSLAADPSVDLTRTWVYANNERLAMGGAGLGFANGAAGLALSPAALAWRREEQAGEIVFTGTLRAGGIGGVTGGDLENLEDSAWRSSLLGLDGPALLAGYGVGTIGAGLLWRNLGVGVLAEGMALRDLESPGRTDEGDLRGAVSAALGQQVAAGAALRLHAARISDGDAEIEGVGLGAEAGVLVQIPTLGANLGLSARSPIADGNPSGGLGVDKMVVPAGGSVGLSWASNAMPTPPSRRPLRFAFDLVVDGPVAGAVSAQSLASGAPVARGSRWTLSPRIGGELEIWPEHLRLLAGSYLEPSRREQVPVRLHGTGGLELGVYHLHLWFLKLPLAFRCAFDLAPRYASLHWVGLGVWHSGLVGPRRGG